MFRKSKTVLPTAMMILCIASGSYASSAPTSQFGFKGWPYRHQKPSVCATPSATPAVTTTPMITQAPSVTASPSELPNETNTPLPTTQPTNTPIVTSAPVSPSPTAVVTATPSPVIPTQTPSTGGDYTTGLATAQEVIALNLLNEDRIRNGLPALSMDPELSRIARMKSTDMHQNNYFAHTSPTYGSASDLLKSQGYSFVSVGENIAHHATVEKSQAAFMSSSGHRQNILGSQWEKVGIGVTYDSQGFVYVTQLFVR